MGVADHLKIQRTTIRLGDLLILRCPAGTPVASVRYRRGNASVYATLCDGTEASFRPMSIYESRATTVARAVTWIKDQVRARPELTSQQP